MSTALTSAFEAAVQKSKTLPSQSPAVLLELYGLFKQATSGDVSSDRPGMFDPRGRAKWDAWEKCGGMTADAAMQAYVDVITRLG